MDEIFKEIKGYDGLYEVSNFGNIRSLQRGKYKILRLDLRANGYLQLILTVNYKQKSYKVHRLVAEAFIPNIENKLQINHINGIKTDNRVENLEWCTGSENILHAYDTGLIKGIKKIYTDDIKDILHLIKKKVKQKEIAKKYNVSRAYISQIKMRNGEVFISPSS